MDWFWSYSNIWNYSNSNDELEMSAEKLATAFGAIIALVVGNIVLIAMFAGIISGVCNAGLSTCGIFNMLWLFVPTIDVLVIWKIIYPLFSDL